MKKLSLLTIGLYLGILCAFSQNSTDSSQYKHRKLKVEEVNFVSSYYHQTGDRASVTGGIGSERLTDLANTIDVKLTKYDKKYRKHTLGIEAGIDVYTSASSDQVDLKANSSASSGDIRIYPSVSWTIENEKKGNTVGFYASASHEFDYFSKGLGISFNKRSKDGNRELGVKAQAYLDVVKLVYPVELRTGGNFGGRGDDYASTNRNSYSGSFTFSQVVNQRLQFMLLMDIVHQQGLLSLPFHRVYLNTGTVTTENLPDTRFKIPVAIRANYFLGDKVVLRSYYRYYHDDWGLNAHTAELETAIKFSSFVSVSPFYRYYTQTAAKYFAPYLSHDATDTYRTSNYDLSAFHSQFIGAGLRLATPGGVLGIKQLKMLELRYGHYISNRTLQADVVTLHIKL